MPPALGHGLCRMRPDAFIPAFRKCLCNGSSEIMIRFLAFVSLLLLLSGCRHSRQLEREHHFTLESGHVAAVWSAESLWLSPSFFPLHDLPYGQNVADSSAGEANRRALPPQLAAVRHAATSENTIDSTSFQDNSKEFSVTKRGPATAGIVDAISNVKAIFIVLAFVLFIILFRVLAKKL